MRSSSAILGSMDHGHVHDTASSEILRRHGRRLTVQRAAIWDVLTSAPDLHLDAETVASRVQSSLPQVNASTVYRTLDLLVEDGLVVRTDLGGGRSFFEPTHEHRHHHLVCERCGAVQHIHDDAFAELGSRLAESVGFSVGERELTVFGTCSSCASDVL